MLGIALAQEHRFKQAGEELAIATRIDPKDPLNWNSLGHFFLDQKQYSEAIKHFEIAIKLDADDYNSRISLAAAHEKAGQLQLALVDLDAASKLRPHMSQPWYMSGTLLLQCDKPQAAIAPLRRAVSINPKLADAQYRLGDALMRSGRGDQAIAPLMACINLAPNAPEALSKLAWLLATEPDAKLPQRQRRGLPRQSRQRTREIVAAIPGCAGGGVRGQKQFDRAAKTASDAAELADATGNTVLHTSMLAAAARYRAGQPTRDATLAGADAGDAIP